MNFKNLNNANDIMDIFLKQNPIPKGKIKNPYLILIDGISGTGKSTVAKIISEKTDIVVLNNDKIRRFIYQTSFNNIIEIEKLVKKIQYYRIEQVLKNGNNCLLDGNISSDFETKISILKQINYKFYIIKLIYDREIVMERVKNRKFDENTFLINGSETINYSKGNIDTFLTMEKEKYSIPKEYIYFEIDTSKDIKSIEKQIEKLIEKIEKEG